MSDKPTVTAENLWRAITLLANSSYEQRKSFIEEMLNDESAGTRSCAASALGGMQEYSAMGERLACEKSKIVRATIKAHMRAA